MMRSARRITSGLTEGKHLTWRHFRINLRETLLHRHYYDFWKYISIATMVRYNYLTASSLISCSQSSSASVWEKSANSQWNVTCSVCWYKWMIHEEHRSCGCKKVSICILGVFSCGQAASCLQTKGSLSWATYICRTAPCWHRWQLVDFTIEEMQVCFI